MVDNSSKDTPVRTGWRSRIGLKKEMPRLADDFRTEPAPAPRAPSRPPAAPSPAARPSASARTGQPQSAPVKRPVAKPAPMAPRRPAPARVPASPQAAKPAAAPARPTPPAPPRKQPPVAAKSPAPSAASAAPHDADSFGERLRAQRKAAEEHARQRAEETRRKPAGTAPGQASGGFPKFTFSPEEIKAAEAERANRQQQSGPAAATPGQRTPPSHSAPPPPPVRNAPPPPPPPSARPAARGYQRPQAPQPYQPSDSYRRLHTDVAGPDASNGYPGPSAYVPPAGQGVPPQGPAPSAYQPPPPGQYRGTHSRELEQLDPRDNEIFDDSQPPVRRAGREDYSAAYRDYDDTFEPEEAPRRSGAWIFVILLIVVLVAAAAGALWFVKTYITPNSTGSSGNVPTITAPSQPPKVKPKPAPKTTPGGPVRRKQIYDRILGNETLEPERIVPTEETPSTPPAATPPAQASPPAGNDTNPLPLPLPPPPTLPGQQGQAPATGPPVASRSATNGQVISQTSAPPSITGGQQKTQATGGGNAPLPLPAVPPPGGDAGNETAQTPSAPAPATQTPPAATNVPLPRSKPRSIVKKARQLARKTQVASARPLPQTTQQLPPPPASSSGSGPVSITPGTPAGGQTAKIPARQPAAPPAKSGSLFDQILNPGGKKQVRHRLIGGRAADDNIASFTSSRPSAPVQPQTRVASVPPSTANTARTQPAPPVTSGYVARITSFRQSGQAQAEYQRLARRYPSLVNGLQPNITEAQLGAAGKVYTLRLGTFASRAKAQRFCDSLIAAGERDCIARPR